MTQLALTSLNYSANLLDVIYKGFKKTIQGIVVGWMIARQTQANQKTAEMLCKYEYTQQDYHWVLADLNSKTIAQIRKEFLND